MCEILCTDSENIISIALFLTNLYFTSFGSPKCNGGFGVPGGHLGSGTPGPMVCVDTKTTDARRTAKFIISWMSYSTF